MKDLIQKKIRENLDERSNLDKIEAFKKDKDFFIKDDEGMWSVVGTETHYCYAAFTRHNQAEDKVKQLQKEKNKSKQFINTLI